MSENPNLSTEGDKERFKGLEIIDDFDSGQLNPRWLTRWIRPESLSITDELDPGKKPVLKITVHSGDFAMDGEDGHMTERAEITDPEEVKAGTDIWYGFSVYIPKDFEISNNRLVIAQWKQPPKQGHVLPSPFVSWRYREGKIIGQVVNESERIRFKFSNVEQGTWNRLITNYVLDENNNSHCQFIVNDRKKSTKEKWAMRIYQKKYGLEWDYTETIFRILKFCTSINSAEDFRKIFATNKTTSMQYNPVRSTERSQNRDSRYFGTVAVWNREVVVVKRLCIIIKFNKKSHSPSCCAIANRLKVFYGVFYLSNESGPVMMLSP